MLTRRTFLASSTVAAAGLWIRNSNGQSLPPRAVLPIPPLLDASTNGGNISLTVGAGEHAFLPGKPVRSFGYSGPILGPAIRARRGGTINVAVQNKMAEPTTVHWHGVLIPGSVDGGPHNVIRPGQNWTAKLSIDQPETTAWFHPHPHHATAAQVYSGLAGLILIEDGSAARLGLPNTYGVDDLPLILQDRVFDRAGAPIYDPGPMGVMAGYRGNAFIVNGVVSPVARVPSGLVRLRLLNGANARFFVVQFSDSRTFHVIASDGGYLTAPAPLQRLLLAPGERYEVLVDFSNGQKVALSTGPDRNLPMMGMMMGGAIPAGGGSLLSFEVDPSLPVRSQALPNTLIPVPLINRAKVARARRFVLNDMMMGGRMMMGGGGAGPVMVINGRPFDMRRVDAATKKGTVELWQIGSPDDGTPISRPWHAVPDRVHERAKASPPTCRVGRTRRSSPARPRFSCRFRNRRTTVLHSCFIATSSNTKTRE